MTRPLCRRCQKPMLLVPDIDAAQEGERNRWRLECRSGWAPSAWQDDPTFWAAWDDLPGDEVVRLEKQYLELQR